MFTKLHAAHLCVCSNGEPCAAGGPDRAAADSASVPAPPGVSPNPAWPCALASQKPQPHSSRVVYGIPGCCGTATQPGLRVPRLLLALEATRTESPSSASELDCQPRLSAARLAPDCPDPPGERIPGVSYFGCSPASRAKLLATLSPREDVWPGRSARAPGLPLHRECGG